jgi:fatty acid desaturase
MNNDPETVRVLVLRRRPFVDLLIEALFAALRVAVTLAVLAGCTYLVFWRGESGWLYVPALILAKLSR